MNDQSNQTRGQFVKMFYRWFVGAVLVLIALGLLLELGSRVVIGEKVIMYPGITSDIEGHIEVEGAQFYPTPGEIRLVSVRTDFQATVLDLLLGWLDSSTSVRDRSDVLGNQTPEQNREQNLTSMANSGEVAIRVALEHLGYDVIAPGGVRIEFVQADAPATGALTAGDVVQAINETPTPTTAELIAALRQFEPGTEIQLTVESFQAPDSGEAGSDETGTDEPSTAEPGTGAPVSELRTESVTLGDREGQPFLGVQVSTVVDLPVLPFEVGVNLGSIGGPSAGLAICLSVIDSLTENELTAGLDVAATGTIQLDGSVGPVGSVNIKAHAVLAAGADLMLVPAAQIEDARSVLGDYIEVVGVESLQDALRVLTERVLVKGLADQP